MDETDIFSAAFSGDQDDAPETLAETPAPEPQPAPVEQTPQEPQPEPEQPAEPEPAPQAPEPKAIEQDRVPITALLDERDKRRALEAENARLRAQQTAPIVPDRYEDPDGYQAHQEQVIEQRLLTQTLNVSERFARKEHGPETVDKAREWALQRFQADPLYYQQVMSNPDPYELVVTDFKREQVFTAMQPTDLDAFLAWKAAQTALAPAPQASSQAAPTPITPPNRPPQSLASAPSAGGLGVVGDEDAFSAEFRKKG